MVLIYMAASFFDTKEYHNNYEAIHLKGKALQNFKPIYILSSHW